MSESAYSADRVEQFWHCRGMRLKLASCSLVQANAFVEMFHRHHDPDVGHKFSVSVVDEFGGCHGVAICGRPKGRGLDDGTALEVTRVCTRGTKNACSMLYGAAQRAAKCLGYETVYTYTMVEEKGDSLRASGWVEEGVVRPDGIGWNNRAGRKKKNQGTKVRWRKDL